MNNEYVYPKKYYHITQKDLGNEVIFRGAGELTDIISPFVPQSYFRELKGGLLRSSQHYYWATLNRFVVYRILLLSTSSITPLKHSMFLTNVYRVYL